MQGFFSRTFVLCQEEEWLVGSKWLQRGFPKPLFKWGFSEGFLGPDLRKRGPQSAACRRLENLLTSRLAFKSSGQGVGKSSAVGFGGQDVGQRNGRDAEYASRFSPRS